MTVRMEVGKGEVVAIRWHLSSGHTKVIHVSEHDPDITEEYEPASVYDAHKDKAERFARVLRGVRDAVELAGSGPQPDVDRLPGVVAELAADRDIWRRRAEAALAEIDAARRTP